MAPKKRAAVQHHQKNPLKKVGVLQLSSYVCIGFSRVPPRTYLFERQEEEEEEDSINF